VSAASDRLQQAEALVRQLGELLGSLRSDLAVPRESRDSRVVATISAKELGEAMGVNARTIRRWVALGQMPKPLRVGRGMRWKRATIDLWMEARKR